MTLPSPVAQLWDDLQTVRALVLQEAQGLTHTRANCRPRETEWSVGEIIDHLTIAEIATGSLSA